MGFLSVQHLSTHDLPPTIHPCLVRWRSHSSVVLKEACPEMLFVFTFEIKNHESLPFIPCVRDGHKPNNRWFYTHSKGIPCRPRSARHCSGWKSWQRALVHCCPYVWLQPLPWGDARRTDSQPLGCHYESRKSWVYENHWISMNEWLSEWLSLPVSQSVSQSVRPSVSQSVSLWVCESVTFENPSKWKTNEQQWNSINQISQFRLTNMNEHEWNHSIRLNEKTIYIYRHIHIHKHKKTNGNTWSYTKMKEVE